MLTIGYGTAVNHEGKFRFSYPSIDVDSQVIISILGCKSRVSIAAEAAREVMNTGFSNIDVNGKSVTAYTQFRQFNGKWML